MWICPSTFSGALDPPLFNLAKCPTSGPAQSAYTSWMHPALLSGNCGSAHAIPQSTWKLCVCQWPPPPIWEAWMCLCLKHETDRKMHPWITVSDLFALFTGPCLPTKQWEKVQKAGLDHITYDLNDWNVKGIIYSLPCTRVYIRHK